MISNILFVGFGGALGAISRFGINEILERHLINSSSYSVLLINVVGCFLIGLIIGTSLPEKNTIYYFYYWIFRVVYNYVCSDISDN